MGNSVGMKHIDHEGIKSTKTIALLVAPFVINHSNAKTWQPYLYNLYYKAGIKKLYVLTILLHFVKCMFTAFCLPFAINILY